MPEEDGTVGGIVCANSDDTDRVIGARRLALLRELASRTWEADTVADVYALSARALASDPRDMPFALIYRLEDDGAHASPARHAAASQPGHAGGARTASRWTDPRPGRSARWCARGTRAHCRRLAEKFPDLPKGPWADPPRGGAAAAAHPPAPMPRRAAS